ncbi:MULTISPECIES: diacylglycerol kinase [unclassified Arsukibacterium]|uniref:diacylglycerol kinase n=1 Tax=unclassified Arsukibacterium TaxID=2635278 RepID=UPI000C446F1C|nr:MULTISPECIES: diacylglycerol kinase [unclassified Arsukibacterium]MAA93797.1 diacylglycerol kinase [Rheinheimera sp.]MBU1308729.1 diacylglycerol kinase [Gammaproteobacteria bacterium]HAW92976.1 diacylglycerol kinase [Candidatus Azambacteria bacterium]MBM33035.1 diacylglycerol kinase [Rheinheimera sp.]MBU1556667.1 diacylglycerol kinase [Gammaproteobacteria bacterium]|tara:strand:- start:94115 stop:94471 length:357 start_codon:yes stop_codon:yes gene_type:complete
MKSEAKGISRLWFASKYSWQGLKAGLHSEAALRQEIAAMAILLPIAMLVNVEASERALLVLSLFFVLIVELLNTAVEVVVDRIGAEFHPLSGKAKDLASAAVLASLICASCVWGIILW